MGGEELVWLVDSRRGWWRVGVGGMKIIYCDVFRQVKQTLATTAAPCQTMSAPASLSMSFKVIFCSSIMNNNK